MKTEKKPKKENGQSMAQWSVAVAMIAVIVMACLFTFAPKMQAILKTISHALNENLLNSQ